MKYCKGLGVSLIFLVLAACAYNTTPGLETKTTARQKKPKTKLGTTMEPQAVQGAKQSSLSRKKPEVSGTIAAEGGNNQTQLDISVTELSQDEQNTLRLLKKSSIAKRIIGSNNSEALAVLGKAKAYFNSAIQAKKNGDYQSQKSLLSKAKRGLFQAATYLQQAGDGNKTSKVIAKRIHSARALLSAYERIAKEKSIETDMELRFERKLNDADKAYRSGDFPTANSIASNTFLEIKKSLIQFRDGQTVVHQLHFDTPEDEFKYELDRNKTHRMLSILLKNNSNNQKQNEKTPALLESAEELRTQAMQEATTNTKKAIRLIEKSTKQIIRAIRALGIYIPG